MTKLRLKIRLSLALAMSLAPLAAHAADAQNDFAVRGIGALSCTAFLNLGQQAGAYRNMALENWMLGYLTADNRLSHDSYDVMALQDPQLFPALVGVMCQANQKASVEMVVASLIKQLAPIKITQNSPILTLHVGNNQMQIRQATLVLVQHGLRARHYGKLREDGKFSDQMQQALASFQKDQKLPVTGLPDAATIIRLLIELPEKN